MGRGRAILALFVSILGGSAQGAEEWAFLGDSQTTGERSEGMRTTNSPGIRLQELLRRQDAVSMSAIGSCGMRANAYLDGSKTRCGYFEDAPDRYLNVPYSIAKDSPVRTRQFSSLPKPAVTVIFLGGNDVGIAPSVVQRDAKKLVDQIVATGSKCFWLGIIDRRGKAGTNRAELRGQVEATSRLIQKAIEPKCTYIDVIDYVRYPDTGGDGIHYAQLGKVGSELSATFATKACGAIAQSLGRDPAFCR